MARLVEDSCLGDATVSVAGDTALAEGLVSDTSADTSADAAAVLLVSLGSDYNILRLSSCVRCWCKPSPCPNGETPAIAPHRWPASWLSRSGEPLLEADERLILLRQRDYSPAREFHHGPRRVDQIECEAGPS